MTCHNLELIPTAYLQHWVSGARMESSSWECRPNLGEEMACTMASGNFVLSAFLLSQPYLNHSWGKMPWVLVLSLQILSSGQKLQRCQNCSSCHFIYPFIQLSIHSFIFPSIHTIYLRIHPPNQALIHPPIHPNYPCFCIHPSIHASIHHSTHSSIHP